MVEPMTALIGVTAVSLAISLAVSLIYKFLINQTKMSTLKEELVDVRKKMKKANEEKNEKAKKELLERSLKLSNQQMAMNMKPMFASIILFFIALPVLSTNFGGTIFNLPFGIPNPWNTTFFIFDGKVSWLGLYIIISIPATVVFRKILGVD